MENNNYSQTKEGKAQSKRLIESRLELGYKNAADFFEACGGNGDVFAYPTWQKYESGERLLSSKAAIKFGKILHKDAEWLRYGDKAELNSDIIQIDVLDVRACCGNGVENFTENVIGQQMMTLPALREFTQSAPENIKIIKAIGESMMPTIHTDDVVWVDISVNTPTSDGLYILCIGSDLLIRRIQINPFDNTATIMADNNQYKPIPHNNYRDIKVIGKVIYHMRKTA